MAIEPGLDWPRCLQCFAILTGVGQNTDVADPHADSGRVLAHFLQFFDRSFVIGDGFLILLVAVERQGKHSPCFDKKPVAAGFLRQLESFLSERYGMSGDVVACLTSDEFRPPDLVPDTIKPLLQIVLWNHVVTSSFLSFSRQRARVGPMLATGMDNLLEISA